MLSSIFIYGVIYALSILFVFKYQKEIIKNNFHCKGKFYKGKLNEYCYLFLFILPVAFLTALRADTVGIDTRAYIEIFQFVKEHNSFLHMFHFYIEKGYYFINMVVAAIVGKPWALFFLLQFINIIFVIKALRKVNVKVSFAIGIFIFYMCYLQLSFNAIRQSISICIILYAYSYILKNDFKRYLMWIFVASVFHKTAIFCILLWIFKTNEKIIGNIKRTCLYLYYTLIFISPIWVGIMVKAVEFLCKHLQVFESYLEIDYKPDFGFLLYIIPPLIIISIFRGNIVRKYPKFMFYYRLLFLQIPLQFLGCYMEYVDRLALYASIVQVILVPVTITSIDDKRTKKIAKGAFIIWYIFYYAIMYIFLNANETYPYYSILQ